ncbi:unnamed protein product [Urochloa decumbens]|uniref:LysM domain-containing protein n=1 Tax=Urochloa decumbens TaxID=240449 RepID=A0ABC9A9W8_9POAL
MANHRAAALLIASLLVAVAIADARLAIHHDVHGVCCAAAGRAGSNCVGACARAMESLAAFFVNDVAAVPALTCRKVHGVKAGETCSSVAQAAGLTQDDFLGFNPNINCEKVFVGQWVCLAATSA